MDIVQNIGTRPSGEQYKSRPLPVDNDYTESTDFNDDYDEKVELMSPRSGLNVMPYYDTDSIPAGEFINWGKEVLLKESLAIRDAGARMDLSFAAAVKLVLSCTGNVVLTGLGKSGHVGGKIAATLSSVGTPATFLHAAEALHGDLGMLNHNDVILAIANGGETIEVITVCKIAKRFGLKVIGITGKPKSTLARMADVVLDASVTEEADTLKLAPTSSTSVCLALGDALAVALMKARGFREEHFGQLHPAGSLGKKLRLVEDIMHKRGSISVVSSDADFHALLEASGSPNLGIVAVVNDDGVMEGAITDGDLRRALLKRSADALNMCAADLMDRKPITVPADLKAVDAKKVMEQAKITSLFVTDSQEKLLGVIRLQDY